MASKHLQAYTSWKVMATAGPCIYALLVYTSVYCPMFAVCIKHVMDCK